MPACTACASVVSPVLPVAPKRAIFLTTMRWIAEREAVESQDTREPTGCWFPFASFPRGRDEAGPPHSSGRGEGQRPRLLAKYRVGGAGVSSPEAQHRPSARLLAWKACLAAREGGRRAPPPRSSLRGGAGRARAPPTALSSFTPPFSPP